MISCELFYNCKCFFVQFCAVFGTAVAPICHCIVHQLGGSCFASVLAACLIIFGRHLLQYSISILVFNMFSIYINSKYLPPEGT